jgi:hypothetical protein
MGQDLNGDLSELLERRVSRLERILESLGSDPTTRPARIQADTIVYQMDDQRLVLAGAYAVERKTPDRSYRWFGQSRLVQMIFPHSRAAHQVVRLQTRRMRGVNLKGIKILIDEQVVIPTWKPSTEGFTDMIFEIPAAALSHTELQMPDVPVRRPKDFGQTDLRTLSFAVYKAEFRFERAAT